MIDDNFQDIIELVVSIVVIIAPLVPLFLEITFFSCNQLTLHNVILPNKILNVHLICHANSKYNSNSIVRFYNVVLLHTNIKSWLSSIFFG